MDKRNLTFIITFLISVAVINVFFHFSDQQKLQEKWQEQQELQHKAQDLLIKQHDENRLPLSQVPSTKLYADKDEKEPITRALSYGDVFFTLNPIGDYETLSSNSKKLLYSLNAPIGEFYPQLFSSQANLEVLKPWLQWGLRPIEDFQGEVLQLWNPEFKQTTYPVLWTKEQSPYLGENPPELNALVLVRQDTQWIPIGFYEASSRTIRPLGHQLGLEFSQLSSTSKAHAFEEDNSLSQDKEPLYYILENDTIQLVISSQGGSITEINLPFVDAENTSRDVRAIEIDREPKISHSPNSHFPLNPAFKFDVKSSKASLVTPKEGGYYPLLRRDMQDANGKTLSKLDPTLWSANIVGDYPEISQQNYKVLEFSNERLVLQAMQNHRTITKTYFLNAKFPPYCFELQVDIDGDRRGLWLTSGVLESEANSSGVTPQIKYKISKGSQNEISSLSLPKDSTILSSLKTDWVLNSNGFFGIIFDALEGKETGLRADFIPGEEAPSRYSNPDLGEQQWARKKLPSYRVMLPLPYQNPSLKLRVFAGPLSRNILKEVDKTITKENGKNPQYEGALSFVGWFSFILRPFAKAMMLLMEFFYQMTHSWAMAIILLTIALRIILFPLNSWSFKSMKRMQELSPKVQELQNRYKKDPKKQQMEIMELYRKEKVSPLSGCLPLLIQLPFLFAMLNLLRNSADLRGASFIPGWIDNLAAPDVLFTLPFHIPFLGNGVHILPILLGATMYLQQWMNTSGPKDPNKMTEQQRQQKAMGNIMTVFFAVMFYNLPSGLNLYWFASSLLGILQQKFTRSSVKSS